MLLETFLEIHVFLCWYCYIDLFMWFETWVSILDSLLCFKILISMFDYLLKPVRMDELIKEHLATCNQEKKI